jgi:hypothetical protein
LLAATLPVVFKHEGNLVALVEREDTGRLERSGMDEDVLPAALRLDEAKALGRVEELYCTCGFAFWVSFPRSGVVIAGQKGRTLGLATQIWGKQMPKGLYAQPQIEWRAPMERTSICLNGVSSAIAQGARFARSLFHGLIEVAQANGVRLAMLLDGQTSKAAREPRSAARG